MTIIILTLSSSLGQPDRRCQGEKAVPWTEAAVDSVVSVTVILGPEEEEEEEEEKEKNYAMAP